MLRNAPKSIMAIWDEFHTLIGLGKQGDGGSDPKKTNLNVDEDWCPCPAGELITQRLSQLFKTWAARYMKHVIEMKVIRDDHRACTKREHWAKRFSPLAQSDETMEAHNFCLRFSHKVLSNLWSLFRNPKKSPRDGYQGRKGFFISKRWSGKWAVFDRVTSPANFFGRCRLKLLLPRPASSLVPFFHEILTHLPIVLEIWVAPPCNMPSKFENSSSPSAPSMLLASILGITGRVVASSSGKIRYETGKTPIKKLDFPTQNVVGVIGAVINTVLKCVWPVDRAEAIFLCSLLWYFQVATIEMEMGSPRQWFSFSVNGACFTKKSRLNSCLTLNSLERAKTIGKAGTREAEKKKDLHWKRVLRE